MLDTALDHAVLLQQVALAAILKSFPQTVDFVCT